MKKMLSLAAMFAVLSYASPASAALNISGDASVRERGEFKTTTAADGTKTKADDLKTQYRVRINGAADLGDGYFFKTQLMSEAPAGTGGAGGWQTVGYGNTEVYTLGVSQFYFGQMQKESHFMVGRIPLGSVSNPVFDLTLYPGQPLEIPVATINNDRVMAVNYGAKIGGGDLNATLVVLDNNATANALLNDGYALHLTYKTSVGDVTLEPQLLTILTKSNVLNQDLSSFQTGIKPWTVGANAGIPAGDAKIGIGAFYTKGNGIINKTGDNVILNDSSAVDYNGYLLRLKAEIGNFMAWYDYNQTTDNTAVNLNGGAKKEYTNNFVWAQYNFPVHKSATGSFSLTPTLRYLTTSDKSTGISTSEIKVERLRTELYATVTF